MYTYTWKKYLPVIRLLMKKSATGEQSLSLNRIDFEKSVKLRKPTCTFSVEIAKGRIRGLNPPVVARDLLETLLQDPATESMLRTQQYGLSMGSDYKLHIKNLTPSETTT